MSNSNSILHRHHTKNHNHLINVSSKLESIKQLQITNNAIIHTSPTGKASLSSAGGVAVYADSSPVPTLDNDNRNGWLFEKTVADASKFNYYFYSKGNKALTLADLKSISAIVSVDKYGASNDLPFFTVYTTMTGSGDAGAWYKSKLTYSITADETIMIGEHIEMYSGVKPVSRTGIRQVEFNTKSTVGTGLDTEEILTVAIHSDSGAGVGLKILCANLGLDFFTGDDIIQTRLKLI